MAAELMALVDSNVPVVERNSTAPSTESGQSKYVLAEARESAFAE
jgi:hypothetical protein